MKKTFTINISGSVFHIDDDAYEKLKNYLHMLSSHFGADADGREILQDIESRIAELFSKKMEAEAKDVIVDSWVDEVIARMGKPEDFLEAEGEDEAECNRETSERPQAAVKRRMYRDPDHRVFGGVCSGMGAYFNIDPVILRIIFFVLIVATSGFWFIVYLVLWIAVPKAKTTAQKLEMRGQEATVSNIEKSIKEEVKEVKESYDRFRSSDSYNKGREHVGRFGEVVFNILKVALKVVGALVGVIMILVGFFGLLAFLVSMIAGHSIMNMAYSDYHSGVVFNLNDVVQLFVSPSSIPLLLISVAVLAAIPLLVILYVGTKIVFRYKSNNKVVLLSGLGVWLVALVVALSVGLGQLADYSERTTVTQSVKLENQDFSTLYLELNADASRYPGRRGLMLDRMRMVKGDDGPVLLGRPRLDVERSNTDEFVLIIRKKSRGQTEEEAGQMVQDIQYNFNQKDSTLYFDPYYNLQESKRWLGQEVDMTIKVPEGKSIFLSDKMIKVIYDIENVSNTLDGDMVGKFWEMKPDGLTLKEAN